MIGGCEIDKARSEQDFDNLIKQTLERVLEEGFDERRIQGILNEVQFSYKQIKSRLLLRFLSCRIWLDSHAVRDGGLDTPRRSLLLFTL